MTIYIYRFGLNCPYPWAEVMDDVPVPVHPGDLRQRVRKLIASGKDWATQSDIVLSMIGWMIRTGKLKLPVKLVYVHADGTESDNSFCSDGSLLHSLPEEEAQFSIQGAGFHYRFV